MFTCIRNFHCLLFILIFINKEILPGFCLKTLLETPNGSVPISDITFNDPVLSYDFITNEPIVLPVKQIVSYKASHPLKITIGSHFIYTVQNQLFFDAATQKFIPANQISDRTVFLSRSGTLYQCGKVEFAEEEHDISAIILDEPHIYFISDLQLMVHNCDGGLCIYPTLASWVIGVVGIAIWGNQENSSLYPKNQDDFIKHTLKIQDDFVSQTNNYLEPFKNSLEHLNHPKRNLLLGEPPNIGGVQIKADDYLDMIQKPYRYGPYLLTGEMTTDGCVKAYLHRLRFAFSDAQHNFYEWHRLGETVFDSSDPYIANFLQMQDEKELSGLREYLKTVPEDLKKELFKSKNIFQEASDLKSRFGCFEKEIYGRKFGIHALYNMVHKYITPSHVLEMIRKAGTLPTKHKYHTLYGHRYSRKFALVENFSKKIVAVGYDKDDLRLFSESTEIKEGEEKKDSDDASKPEDDSDESDPSDEESTDESKPKDKKPKTIEEIAREATPGRKTQGKTKQYEKPGGFEEALEDFESLGPTNIKDIPTGKKGDLPDGRTANVRSKSDDTRPTLEVLNRINGKKIKIRYGAKQ